MNVFGERLKELRKLNGDTQTVLAKKLCFTAGMVSMYERGLVMPATDRLVDICKLYHTSADYLLGLTDFDPSDDWRKNNG